MKNEVDNQDQYGEPSTKKAKTQPSVLEHARKKESVEEIVAKMVAVSNISLRAIAMDEFIQSSLKVKGYKAPNNPSVLAEKENDPLFKMPPRKNLRECLKKLLVRLFPSSNENVQEEQEDGAISGDKNGNMSFADRLQNAISETGEKKAEPLKNKILTMAQEMKLFEDSGERTKNLELIYQALLPPTSVAAERAFSTSNNFVSKTRNRLGDSTIDDLCFLKHYFKKD